MNFYETIPIYVICFNNGFMVNNTVKNCLKKFKNPIKIIDNASTSKETKLILQELSSLNNVTIQYMLENKGPYIIREQPEFENVRNNLFIITDPDLELDYLPEDTIKYMYDLSTKHNIRRVGLALRIDETEDLLDVPYSGCRNVYEFEKGHWEKKFKEDCYTDLFEAGIDTTFTIENPHGNFLYPNTNWGVRMAGKYAVRHLPWHKSYFSKLSKENYLEYFGSNNKYSTIVQTIIGHNYSVKADI